jgi:excisionase family DNA binding protein
MHKKQTTLRHSQAAKRAGSRARGDDPSTPEERLLTAGEVARILHVSRSMVHRLVERGDLPSLRIGFARRFRLRNLQRYIQKQSDPSKPTR